MRQNQHCLFSAWLFLQHYLSKIQQQDVKDVLAIALDVQAVVMAVAVAVAVAVKEPINLSFWEDSYCVRVKY